MIVWLPPTKAVIQVCTSALHACMQLILMPSLFLMTPLCRQAKSPSKAARTGYEAPMGKTPSACYMRTLEAILASNAKHDKQLEVQKSKEQKEVKEEQKKVVAQPQVKAAKVDAAGGNGKVAKLQLGKVQRQAGKQIGTQGQKTGKVGHRKAQQ